MSRRYLIVGCGVAGLSAAEAIHRHDLAADVTLVSDDLHGYYSRPGLAYVLNRSIPERHIFPIAANRLRAIFPKRIHARARSILPAEHLLLLEDGRQVAYDRLLIATGARSIRPDFPGNDLAGMVRLNSLADVREILKRGARGQPAIVIGGGIIAIELAEGLVAQGMKVRYFLRGDRFWASMLDETESRLVERGLAAEGIVLHYKTQIAQAEGRRGALRSVVTLAGKRYPCRVLGSAIGLASNLELATAAGLATDKGILVDETLQSSAADIFAAGDVAQVRDPDTGTTWIETLWPVARMEGALAGANMAGVRTICRRPVPFNVVRIGGITTCTLGEVERGRDEDLISLRYNDRRAWQGHSDAWLVERGDEVSRVRILMSERAIVGAVIMGDQGLARPLLDLVEAGADISTLRPELERAQNDPARSVQLITSFYANWKRDYAAVQP